ncbi:MAG: hypothetical protein ACKJSG_16405 [Lentisphaeria bacterium]
MSTALALPVLLGSKPGGQVTEVSGGQAISGFVSSKTVTNCVAVERLPDASVAVQVRLTMITFGPPSINRKPKDTLGFRSQSSVAETSGVGMPFAHSKVTSAGTPKITGAVLSGSQSGFDGILDANACADKNAVNMIAKNVADKRFIL